MDFKEKLIEALENNDVFLSLSPYQRMTIADIAEKQLLIHSVVKSVCSHGAYIRLNNGKWKCVTCKEIVEF